MSKDLGLLILVGQLGAGKSEVSRYIVETTGVQHLTLEKLRHRSVLWEEPASIVNQVVSKARTSPTILECTGTSRDFEEIVEGVRGHGIDCHVILLECRMETALRRVLSRDPLGRPRSGRTWASELRRTESRLRLMPADHTISTETADPKDIATRIYQLWIEEHEEAKTQFPLKIDDNVSFSKLAAFQVCPLSYKLKYTQETLGASEPRDMFLGRILHETLAWMYGAMSDSPSRGEVIPWFTRRLAESAPASLPPDALEAALVTGEHALLFHYDVVFQSEKSRTIAVEKWITTRLAEGVNFVGRVDRLSVDVTGVVEIIDYKTFDRKLMHRVRLPDRLQVAGYGAAILRELDLQVVIAREISLQTGREERFLMTIDDARQIELALLRWARRVYRTESFRANIGTHCVSCQFYPVCPEARKVAI